MVSDADLAPRLEPLLNDIVKILNTMTPVITYIDYFEFLLEFVKFYENVLHNYILEIVQTLINRVLAEHGKYSVDKSMTLPS